MRIYKMKPCMDCRKDIHSISKRCSNCYYKSRIGHHVSEETKRKIVLGNKGKKRSEETKRRMSIAKKGLHISPKTEFKKCHITWNKGTKGLVKTTPKMLEALKLGRGLAYGNILGHKMSEETKRKIGNANKIRMIEYWKHNTHLLTEKQKQSLEIGRKLPKVRTPEWTQKQSQSMKKGYAEGRIKSWNYGHQFPERSGNKHPNWRGGQSSFRGKDWKKITVLVRCRDGFKCLRCGIHETNKVFEVNHKIPYRICKNNDWDNLETLCMSCHRITDWNYFKNNNVPRKILEYEKLSRGEVSI